LRVQFNPGPWIIQPTFDDREFWKNYLCGLLDSIVLHDFESSKHTNPDVLVWETGDDDDSISTDAKISTLFGIDLARFVLELFRSFSMNTKVDVCAQLFMSLHRVTVVRSSSTMFPLYQEVMDTVFDVLKTSWGGIREKIQEDSNIIVELCVFASDVLLHYSGKLDPSIEREFIRVLAEIVLPTLKEERPIRCILSILEDTTRRVPHPSVIHDRRGFMVPLRPEKLRIYALETLFRICKYMFPYCGNVALTYVEEHCSEVMEDFIAEDIRKGKCPIRRAKRDELILISNLLKRTIHEKSFAFSKHEGFFVRMYERMTRLMSHCDGPLRDAVSEFLHASLLGRSCPEDEVLEDEFEPATKSKHPL
jgi:hypothetical protein